MFSASIELQSFRFLNPKTPFLAQYSDPTVPQSTVKFKSTSIGFRQTYSQAKGHLSFSFKRFPESPTLSKAEILNIRTTSHKVIILGSQIPESGLHDAQSIAKADSNKKFLSRKLKTQSIQNLQIWEKYLLCYQQP